jgi:sulfur-oxidizing protein SoxY
MAINRPPRREVLKRGAVLAALLGCGALTAREARAMDADPAFEATTLDAALMAMGGIPQTGAGIVLEVPDLVENGAVVPVTVTSHLPGTQEISIVAEFNPYPLVVSFRIPEGTEPFVFTRVKIAQSGSVYAVVRAEGRLYAASRPMKVLAGGCG